MKHLFAASFACLVGLFVAAAPALADSRNFQCGDGAGTIRVTIVSQQQISADIDMIGSSDGRMTMDMYGGGDASGSFNFDNGEYGITINAGLNSLTYTAPDFGSIDCVTGGGAAPTVQPKPSVKSAPKPVAASGKFPMDGRSCGGVLRSKPSLNSSKVASVGAGQRLIILAVAGEMDGYSWFQVKVGSKTGYQWGGIMSAASGQLAGAFTGC